MPTPQGSNAPVRRVEEGCYPAPLKLPTCNEHELSLGSHALEDRQTRGQAYLDDLSGSALTPKPLLECHAPSHSHSTQRGYAPAGTDPHFQSTVCNSASFNNAEEESLKSATNISTLASGEVVTFADSFVKAGISVVATWLDRTVMRIWGMTNLVLVLVPQQYMTLPLYIQEKVCTRSSP